MTTQKEKPEFKEGQFLVLKDEDAMVVIVTEAKISIVKIGGTPDQTFKSLTKLTTLSPAALRKQVIRYDGVWVGTRRMLVKYGAALKAKQ